MPRQTPICPDCSSRTACPIVYGEPPLSLQGAVERGEIILGGCVLGDTDPAWSCTECGHRFGNREKPYKPVPARTANEWTELVKTMLPQPVTVNEAGELLGGKPVTVIVRVTTNKIIIMEASWDWIDSHRALQKGKPFATTPL